METRANYVLIGAFVFLAMAAVLIFTVWISKAQFNREYAVYDVVFVGPVNGMSEGGEVRFNGIKVGEVTRLALDQDDPSHVIARVRIDANTPVRTDSKAVLELQGVTGLTYIQISAGTNILPLLRDQPNGSPPRIETQRNELEVLFAGGADVLASSAETLHRLNNALSRENVARFASILENIEELTGQAAEDGALIADMRAMIDSLRRAGDTVNQAAITIDEAARSFDGQFTTVATNANDFLANIDGAVDGASSAINTAETSIDQLADAIGPGAEDVLNELSGAAREMRILINRLDAVVQEVERDPREFVLGDAKPYE